MSEPSGLTGSWGGEAAAPAEPAIPTEPAAQPTPAAPATPAWQATPAEYAVGPLVDRQSTEAGLAPDPEPFAPPTVAPARRSHRRALRGIAIGSLLILGIVGVGGGGTLLVREFTRGATSSELRAAAGRDVATRWQRLAAGQIFPARVRYLSAENIYQSAHRVGIAPSASCQAGLDSAVLDAIRNLGCAVVLRATYADQSGALIATVGAAVLASPHAAEAAIARLGPLGSSAGVRPVAFNGTITDLFVDSRMAAFGTPIASGPYVFFYAAGYADGQPGRSAGTNSDLDSLGQGLVTKVEHILTGHGQPCTKDIRC